MECIGSNGDGIINIEMENMAAMVSSKKSREKVAYTYIYINIYTHYKETNINVQESMQ